MAHWNGIAIKRGNVMEKANGCWDNWTRGALFEICLWVFFVLVSTKKKVHRSMWQERTKRVLFKTHSVSCPHRALEAVAEISYSNAFTLTVHYSAWSTFINTFCNILPFISSARPHLNSDANHLAWETFKIHMHEIESVWQILTENMYGW